MTGFWIAAAIITVGWWFRKLFVQAVKAHCNTLLIIAGKSTRYEE